MMATSRLEVGFSSNKLSEKEYLDLFEKFIAASGASNLTQGNGIDGSLSESRVVSGNNRLVVKRERSRLINFADAYDIVLGSKNPSFTLKLNRFALLTVEEVDELRKGFAPLISEAEHGETKTEFAEHQTNKRDLQSFPIEIDWRPYLPVIKTQGQCGGCWSFTAIGVLESHFAIRNHGLVIALSEQELLSCDRVKNRGCAGGNYYYTLTDYALTQGVSTGKHVPYALLRGGELSSTCESSLHEPLLKVGSSDSVVFVDRSEQALMMALQRGPVAIAISGYNPIFQYYSKGILNDYQGCGTGIDHAVLVVGYGEEERTGTKFWVIRNSWGSDWGEHGYARLIRGNEEVLQQTNGLGICGMLTQMNTLKEPPICLTPENCDGEEDSNRRFCTVDHGCLNDTSVLGLFNNGTTTGNPFTPLTTVFGTEPIGFAVIGLSIAAGLALIVALSLTGVWFVRRRSRRSPVTMDESPFAVHEGNTGAAAAVAAEGKRELQQSSSSSSSSSSSILLESSPDANPIETDPSLSYLERDPSISLTTNATFDEPEERIPSTTTTTAVHSRLKTRTHSSSSPNRRIAFDDDHDDEDEQYTDDGEDLLDIESFPSGSPSRTTRSPASFPTLSPSFRMITTPAEDCFDEDAGDVESIGSPTGSFSRLPVVVTSTTASKSMTSSSTSSNRPGSPLKRLLFSLQHHRQHRHEEEEHQDGIEDEGEDVDVEEEAAV